MTAYPSQTNCAQPYGTPNHGWMWRNLDSNQDSNQWASCTEMQCLRPLRHSGARVGPCRKDLYTIPGSWKCPSSSMACILTRHVIHWACLGCSGLACTTACSSSRQYLATNAQPLKRSGTTFHRTQSTAWSTLCEGDVVLHEANGGHTRYWQVFCSTPLPFFKGIWDQ